MKVFLFLCLLQAALRLATMDVHCLLTFRHLSKVGFVYSVTGFDVIRANQNFKQSDYPLSIWYNDSTVFNEITEPVSPIPVERFRFRNNDELLCLDNTNTHLPGKPFFWLFLLTHHFNWYVNYMFFFSQTLLVSSLL